MSLPIRNTFVPMEAANGPFPATVGVLALLYGQTSEEQKECHLFSDLCSTPCLAWLFLHRPSGKASKLSMGTRQSVPNQAPRARVGRAQPAPSLSE